VVDRFFHSHIAHAAGELKPSKGWLSGQIEGVNALLHPFSDKAINSKLLALCVAQALCSVATLIHDTYLPIYLQDVLGESLFLLGKRVTLDCQNPPVQPVCRSLI
jgi:hypothetical protein